MAVSIFEQTERTGLMLPVNPGAGGNPCHRDAGQGISG